jgi:hypothetical protein
LFSQITFTGEHLSIGGMADSYYEYLLKQYLQAGGQRWEEAVKASSASASASADSAATAFATTSQSLRSDGTSTPKTISSTTLKFKLELSEKLRFDSCKW